MTRLYRSQTDKKICGLCGGLAEIFNVDATLLRMIVVVTAFFSFGTVLLLYIIACIVIPKESTFTTEFAHNGPSGHCSKPKRNSKSYHDQEESASPNIDEMMKDVEQKAMWKEIEELRARVAKYEKGDV